LIDVGKDYGLCDVVVAPRPELGEEAPKIVEVLIVGVSIEQPLDLLVRNAL
jgi:hypothetical protein